MMSDKKDEWPERITVLAKDFTPAAMEFHRRNMSEKGYRLEGTITPRKFLVTDGLGEPDELLDGDIYYAATFVRGKTDS
ncbi:MAG: hypothetical protein V6Z81_08565 [Parvularculales bacterium]